MNPPLRTVYALALIPAMVLPTLAALLYFVWFSDQFWARGVYGAIKIFTVVWPLFCLRMIFREPWPDLQLLSGKHARAVPAGILSGLVMVGLVWLLLRTPLLDVLLESTARMRAKAGALGVLDHYVVFALFLAVVHSLIEEYYWRWFVYGRLRQVLPEWLALLLGGLSFAAHHAVIAGQFFPMPWAVAGALLIAGAGIFWCRLYRNQETLMGAWTSHMVVDMGILWIGHQLLFS